MEAKTAFMYPLLNLSFVSYMTFGPWQSNDHKAQRGPLQSKDDKRVVCRKFDFILETVTPSQQEFLFHLFQFCFPTGG